MDSKIAKRVGESHESQFRSGRFYTVANEWYYSVREKEDQGPFPTKTVAEDNLKSYLTDCDHFKSDIPKFDIRSIKLF